MGGENFQKSIQPNTETVIIENMISQTINGRHHYTSQSRNRLNKAISKEIQRRPQMKLTQIIELNAEYDNLGNLQPHPTGILLLFEKRNDSLDSIKQDIADLQSNIQRILEKLDGWR